MPNAITGFSGNEIVTYVQNWIGNQSNDFQTFLQQTLPLAEYRFCKMFDWSFLTKENLPLTVVSGTTDYQLTTSTIGFNMAGADVDRIFSKANGIPFRKMELSQLRRLDPSESSGTSTSFLTTWAPTGDTSIMVYPQVFADTIVYVEGKITPTPLLTLTNYPTIPYRYQESFINYLITLALMRENDDRFQMQKAETDQMIRLDIQADMGDGDEVLTPRIKALQEQGFDGISANLATLYTAWIFSTQNY